MPIPKEILNVERPKNTNVICYGKNKDKFAVRERIGCKNVNGRHLPINGAVIGHIVNFQYVPISTIPTVSKSPIDLLKWGAVQLCDNLAKDLLDELKKVYNDSDALKIYLIAILRTCDTGITNYELKQAYEESFLSILHPNASLSKNTITTFLKDLGKASSKIKEFMTERIKKVDIKDNILIDGTLKSNDSQVNTLSDFSRKSITKGTKDISLIHAFDLEMYEPICSSCYPGNALEYNIYQSFLETNNLSKGIIVTDKGFPAVAAESYFKENPDLHFLNPVKRNRKFITTFKLYDFTHTLTGYEGITYTKYHDPETNKYYYSYRDVKKASIEESDWLKQAVKKKNYSLKTLEKKRRYFGTIVLESDLDLAPVVIYKMYMTRWEIEVVAKYYKNTCDFDETRVHNDYSVIGSEFCNFLATIITFRLIKKFDQADLLKNSNYGKIMKLLDRAMKVRDKKDQWKLVNLNKGELEKLVQLSLIPSPSKPGERKVGRPKKVEI
jgi:hypothetical protein